MTPDDDAGVVEQAKDKASEKITLSRGELLMLRIAAVTGVASLISHGADAMGKIWGWW